MSLDDSIRRDEEDFMLETIPDQAWNLAIEGASKIDIVRAIRDYGRVDHGLKMAVLAAEKMQRMLGNGR